MNPLLLFWRRLLGDDDRRGTGRGAGQGAARATARRPSGRVAVASSAQASATIFLVLRRMRAPFIVLIFIFAVSVLGLTLVPGQDAEGNPSRMGFFDAFYVMAYTASTIGFGELPHPFTIPQRMWVTGAIFLSVIGWAYAIGSLLALFQDRSFRAALAMQRFTRRVARLREPFLLVAGYGRTGELLGHAFDEIGRRFVVVDIDEDRIESLEIDAYHADVPGLVADASNPGHLGAAGLDHPMCEGVLALTNDDATNLAVTMSAALLRPDLRVVARTVSPAIADRMHAFGTPSVVNPFDRFGDHLRLAMRSPSAYQLLTWLEGGPGTTLPLLGDPPTGGRWVVCGYGRFGRELTEDLRAEGLEVTVVEANPGPDPHDSVVVGDASDPEVMRRAGVDGAAAFVAGTDDDTTNLSLVAAARRMRPDLYVAARQNVAANAPLFGAMELDLLLVPSEVVAHEVYAQLSTPLLWRFLQEMPALGDDWAAAMTQRLTARCGFEMHPLWKLRLTPAEAPALRGWLASGEARLGDLLRDPDDRDVQLATVVLLLARDDQVLLGPGPETPLAEGDELLMAGPATARRELGTTLLSDATAAYVVADRQLPESWIWRRLRRD